MLNVKDLVKDKQVEFLYFREGNFIYRTDDGFEFPVPLSDIGTATLHAKDKAILFMRRIKQQVEFLNSETEPASQEELIQSAQEYLTNK